MRIILTSIRDGRIVRDVQFLAHEEKQVAKELSRAVRGAMKDSRVQQGEVAEFRLAVWRS